MSAPDGLRLSRWAPRFVVTRHIHWLHDRGIEAYGRDGVIYFQTPEREEAVARIGYWFIEGTRSEIYAVKPEVHADKYQPVSS